MTVTLIAEPRVDQPASTAPRRPDRSPVDRAHAMTLPVRLRRPPASEPPYDTAFPDVATPIHSASTPVGARRAPDATDVPPQLPAPAAIGVVPPVAASAQRYVRICLEVLNGFRPASHLRTLSGPVEFSTVVSQLSRRRNGRGHFAQVADQATEPVNDSGNRLGARSVAGRVRNLGATSATEPALPAASNTGPARYGTPTTTAGRNAPGAAQPFRLLRLRLSEPRDGVAEIVAVLSYAGSSLAMALRLERHGDQWLCALVQVI